jgi:hypothetical protein
MPGTQGLWSWLSTSQVQPLGDVLDSVACTALCWYCCRYTQNPDGSGGFVSPGACVTQAGYGYDSRGSQKCDKGYYNDKDSYAKCKPCGYALTTRAPGAAATAADCGIEPGYGFGTTHYFNRTLIKCPVGKFYQQWQLRNVLAVTTSLSGTA